MEVEATTLNSCDKHPILGDPGTDSGGEGKSKQAEKYGTKKSKERREEPLGTMSYQTTAAVLTSDWCQKTFVFFCPIRRQNSGDHLELVW